jgi:hypothetical protein
MQKSARQIIYSFLFGKDLRKLAEIYETDKEGVHFYAKHYQHHFQSFRRKKFNLLEIGVGGYEDPRSGGNSLRMWKAYFPNAGIYGIDIYNKTHHDEKRIKTFRGNQTDENFLKDVMAKIGGADIIIDDGSHYNDEVIKTFRILFPLLNNGGIYVIEDLQTSYWDEMIGKKWGGSSDLKNADTSMNLLKSLADGLNYEEFTIDGYVPTYFDRNITSVHFYHNLAFICKGDNSEGSNVLGKRFP